MSLSNDNLEHIQRSETAKENWQAILYVFKRHTLINKHATCGSFYIVSMASNESVLSYLNRVKQLAFLLKDMGVTIDDKELAIGFLNPLLKRFENLIVALDNLGSDDEKYTSELVRSRLLQAEQRTEMRDTFHQNNDSSTLFNCHSRDGGGCQRSFRTRRPFKCTYCARTGYTQKRCWSKNCHARRSDLSGRPKFEKMLKVL